ncbi:transmembrane protein 87A-like [Mizuhopecten yessoensis]|uniref:transmembrane protein 87A-like n=1 Tax=Mizuhopecten yessoensis TaxID=6573 RepID=UPI000B45E1AC|nr:transmembrane protein 87A-like [Mizuhopecten yessoensis]
MTEIMLRLTVQLLFLVAGVSCIPEQGKWVVPFNQDHTIFGVMKSMYKGTRVAVKIDCKEMEGDLDIKWLLRYSPCSEEYIGLETNPTLQEHYMSFPDMQMIKEFQKKYTTFEFFLGENVTSCQGGVILLPDMTNSKPTIVERGNIHEGKAANSSAQTDHSGTSGVPDKSGKTPAPGQKVPDSASEKTKSENAAKVSATTRAPVTTNAPVKDENTSRRRRATKTKQNTNKTDVSTLKAGNKVDRHYYLKAWKDGVYAYILSIKRKQVEDSVGEIRVSTESPKAFHVDVTIEMIGDHEYISAQDWPLLIFYGVMGLVYITYGIAWLVMLACSWRDLLRVQFWIGAVIALGMLEKAVFYAEFQSISSTGQSVRGAVIFAEFVSCLKRTLARILVIIVSLGFGIVKPRLGPTFRKVIGVGVLYFFVSLIEGCMRQLQTKGDNSKDILAAQVPLAVIDASICWWIFASLIQTTRTLRLRRNIVKLSLYRHFTNLLIFAVLASVVYMIWSLSSHKLKVCITDWRELWVDEAFWHLLFSVMLLVIMVLWRPSINNQRYAFSPLLDAADDEDEEALMNDAFDGMKMRGVKSPLNGSPKQRDGRASIEDDLKWVEENIPTSLTDKALPSLLDDSEEEMMTAKYEVNKMQ